MLKLIKRLTGDRAAARGTLAYEEARALLETEKPATRRDLAQRTDLKPEMLYYLAEDSDERTRALVAANPSTPHQANALLAEDEAASVRQELAARIGRLLPDLEPDAAARLRDQTLELIEKLARDVEISVCGPILRYSPLLSDADLIELIATTQIAGVIEAIAGREALSADVSDEVVASLDIPAVATLLANSSAEIRNSTMDKIVKNAAEVAQWHEPISLRPDLSIRAVRRIAQFVGRDLLHGLADRLGMDEETRRLLSGRLHERLDEGPESETEVAAATIVQRAREQGRLDAAFITDAAEEGHGDQVAYAMSLLSGLPLDDVRRVLGASNGKAITSLVWRARLPMRVSVVIQTHVMHLKPPALLPARNGSEFPMSEDEMTRLLDYFGLAAKSA